MVTPVQRLDRFVRRAATTYLAGLVGLSTDAAFALIGIIGWGVNYGHEASRTG